MIQLGWSQRRAAKHLGITQTHLCLVLCGKRESRSLLTRIAQLPPAPFIPHGSPYVKQQTKTKAQTQAGNGAHHLLPTAPKSRRVRPPRVVVIGDSNPGAESYLFHLCNYGYGLWLG